MKIEVNKNYVKFNTNTKVNKREFKATPLEFSFSKEYEGLTCKAVFSIIPKDKDETITFYQQPIINNECFIPYEVMDGEGILIGVYGYSVDGDELLVRYSPEPKNLWFLEGSYYEGAETPEEILPSQFEQYTSYLNSQIELINEKITELDRINIESEEITNGVRISITNSEGETTTTEIHDGAKGDKGDPGEPGEPGEPGTTDYEDLTNKPSINGTTLVGDVSLEDIGIGNVFTIKGSVATPNDLPLTGNSIGDVYYVESVMAGYVWIEDDNVERWEELGEPIDLSNYQTKFQFESIPTASSTYLDSIIQYVGTTTNDYTQGYFYQCVSDGQEPATYSWENIQVQEGGNITQTIPIWECTSGSTYDFVPANISGYNIEYNKWYIAGNDFKAKASVYNNLFELVGKGDLFKIVNPNTSNTYYGFIHLGCGGTGQYFTSSPSISIWKKGITSITDLVSTKTLLNNYGFFGTLSTNNTSGTDSTALAVNNTRAYTPTADYHPSTKKYVDDSVATKQDIIQYSTIPTASASNEGKIVQYTGATDSTYTNGYFYQCVSDGQDPATYSWENIQVQTGGSITQNIEYWDCVENNTYDFKYSNLASYNIEPYKFYIAKKKFKAKTNASGNSYELVGAGDLFQVMSSAGTGNYYSFIHIGKGGYNYQWDSLPAISIWTKGNLKTENLLETRGILSNYSLYGTASNQDTPIGSMALATDNTKAYTPSSNYNPATKKYVDDLVGNINTILATLTTPSNGGGN